MTQVIHTSPNAAVGFTFGNGPVTPSSGGTGVRQMIKVTGSAVWWVLNNGTVWNNLSAPTGVTFSEKIVGFFTDTGSSIYAMGASGAYYNVQDPSTAAGALPVPISFCGFVPETVDTQGVTAGAYYATGGKTSTFRYDFLTGEWGQVALGQIKPGNPDPLPQFDTGSAVFGGVAIPKLSETTNGVLVWIGVQQ